MELIKLRDGEAAADMTEEEAKEMVAELAGRAPAAPRAARSSASWPRQAAPKRRRVVREAEGFRGLVIVRRGRRGRVMMRRRMFMKCRR